MFDSRGYEVATDTDWLPQGWVVIAGHLPRDQPARSGAARSAGPSPFSSACQGRSLRVMRPTDGFVRFKKANCLRICFLRAEQVQMLDVIL